jgi:hypothetical protein
VQFDYPGRVRSQITNVVCQIQWFDFDRILVVSRTVIIRTCAPLRIKPLYERREGFERKGAYVLGHNIVVVPNPP